MTRTEKLLGSIKNDQKGFTLVELMVVVAIIGILIATAVPLYGNIVNKAEKKVNDANIKIILGAIDMYRAEHGFDTEPKLNELEDYISNEIKPPKNIGNSYAITYDEEGIPSVNAVDVENEGKGEGEEG